MCIYRGIEVEAEEEAGLVAQRGLYNWWCHHDGCGVALDKCRCGLVHCGRATYVEPVWRV